MKGTFIGVGVGPGDSELLTIKGVEAIKQADVIVAPISAEGKNSTALEIAKPFVSDNAKVEKLLFPMVYDPEVKERAWNNSLEKIKTHLDGGMDVVFLTLGDPMLYSTYIYVMRGIKGMGYEVQTIPGIPSFCAAAARAGVPLAEEGENLAVVAACYDQKQLDQILDSFDNVVLMKISARYEEMVEALKNKGFVPGSVMVSRCGLPDEKILEDLNTDEKVSYLSLILGKKGRKY